jgi:transcriptional regulator with XRE-family HTH domain
MAQRKRGENLGDLVTRLLAELDMSGREFARRAEERGYSVSHTTINSVANGTRQHVTDDTLSAIAEVFSIDEQQVRKAAGAPARDDTTDPQLIALHKTLTPNEKEAALRMYREYVRTLRGLRDSNNN